VGLPVLRDNRLRRIGKKLATAERSFLYMCVCVYDGPCPGLGGDAAGPPTSASIYTPQLIIRRGKPVTQPCTLYSPSLIPVLRHRRLHIPNSEYRSLIAFSMVLVSTYSSQPIAALLPLPRGFVFSASIESMVSQGVNYYAGLAVPAYNYVTSYCFVL
jgi:hypothetical protein